MNPSWIYREPIVNLIKVHLSRIYCGSMVNLSWIYREPGPDASRPSSWRIESMKIMEFGVKWVHMAWYELILKLDGVLWLRIILKPLLTPKRVMEWPEIRKKIKNILELAKYTLGEIKLSLSGARSAFLQNAAVYIFSYLWQVLQHTVGGNNIATLWKNKAMPFLPQPKCPAEWWSSNLINNIIKHHRTITEKLKKKQNPK